MHYQKIVLGNTVIEFHNNWQGVETVIVNGHRVSQKSSVWGADHVFTTIEQGRQIRYVLRTKVDNFMGVRTDLFRNGRLIKGNMPVHKQGSRRPGRSASRRPKNNPSKAKGLAKLKDYELQDALAEFEKAIKVNPNDPEIHFHMACAYSILEKTESGFEALKNAVKHGLKDQESILNHDMLAYLRIHDAFEDFLDSDFTEYDSTNMKDGLE